MNLNKQLVTKEDLLKKVSDLEIYKCYAPELDIELGKRQISPLRKENNASFALFAYKNEILFKDFVLGGGDCIKFVQLLFGEDFFSALSRIVIDFNLTDHFGCRQMITGNKPTSNNIDRDEVMKDAEKAVIQIKSRKWLMSDARFWIPFGIEVTTLNKYNVRPLSHIFVNDKIITCDDTSYAFVEHKDGKETYKIYQPNKEKFKWINNHDESVWQGWEQLPERGDILIITKSLKDVMTITNLTGIPAVSLQAEGVLPKEHIMDELKERFDTIFIWYDNDFDSEENWGRQFGLRLATEFDLIQIEIPDEEKIKDPSDYCAKKGPKETIELINNLIDVPF